MEMYSRMEQLARQIPHPNRDIALYARHVIEALEQFEEQHLKLVAAQALAGIKPDGEQEQAFYATVRQIKEQMVATLELTLDDLTHKGDKHYEKNFTDGVE
jgi:hypothetical protein